MEHPDARVGLGNLVEPSGRAVPRPVVGKNDLGRLRQLVERLRQSAVERGQRLLFVVDGYDDGNVHGTLSRNWRSGSFKERHNKSEKRTKNQPAAPPRRSASGILVAFGR